MVEPVGVEFVLLIAGALSGGDESSPVFAIELVKTVVTALVESPNGTMKGIGNASCRLRFGPFCQTVSSLPQGFNRQPTLAKYLRMKMVPSTLLKYLRAGRGRLRGRESDDPVCK